MFAHFISGRISNGSFVDLGCNDARFHSNSASLEWVGWSGLLVDIIPGICSNRKGRFICSDAAKPNTELNDYYASLPAIVNYLSVDCDGATIGALEAFPLNRIMCQSITAEHDLYRVGDGQRNKIREYLTRLGYDLVCADVIAPGYGQFEDWWAHPILSSVGTRDRIRCSGKVWSEMAT